MFSTVVHDLMVLMVFLLFGFILRELIKPLQKIFLPAGVIGGTLALILGPQVLGLVEIPETWSGMASPMINIVLTCMIFGTVINRSKMKTYMGAIVVVATTYFAQLFVGTLVGMGLSQIWSDLPYGWGIMTVFTFWGGHGAGSSAGTLFEEMGVENMLSMGIVLATIGLIVAMVVGMVLVNIGIRRGYATNLRDGGSGMVKADGGALPMEKRRSLGVSTVSSSGINGLALQICFIMLSMWIGEKLFGLLAMVIPQASNIPALLYGIVGAAILWAVMQKTKLDRYVDTTAVNTISGVALEVCIIAATATMNLTVFATYFAPIVIYSIIIIAVMIFICMVLVRRWIKKDWFELAMLFFGQGTGSAPSGLALARCVDPEGKAISWDAFGVATGVFTPLSSTLVALLPILAMQSLWACAGIGAAATMGLVLFGELVLKRTKL